jgi:hypothetical protein
MIYIISKHFVYKSILYDLDWLVVYLGKEGVHWSRNHELFLSNHRSGASCKLLSIMCFLWMGSLLVCKVYHITHFIFLPCAACIRLYMLLRRWKGCFFHGSVLGKEMSKGGMDWGLLICGKILYGKWFLLRIYVWEE